MRNKFDTKQTSRRFFQRCAKMDFVANKPIGSFHVLPMDNEVQFSVEIHEYELFFTWFFAFVPDLKYQDQGRTRLFLWVWA